MCQPEKRGLWRLGVLVLWGVLVLSGCSGGGGGGEGGDAGDGQAAPAQVLPSFIENQSLRFENGLPFGIQFGEPSDEQPKATLLIGDFGSTNAASFTLVSNGFMASGIISRLGQNDPYVLHVQRSTFRAGSGPQANARIVVEFLNLTVEGIVRAQSSQGSADRDLQCDHLSPTALATTDNQNLLDRRCLVVSSTLVGPQDVFTIPLSTSNAGSNSGEQIAQFVLTHAPRLLDLQEATTVDIDASTTGVLEEGGDVDLFRIELHDPGLLRVRTIGTTDTFGTLLDANGQFLATNDDIGSEEFSEGFDLNFGISRMLNAGEYFVEVRGFDVSITGAYVIVTSFTPKEGISVTSRAASASAPSQGIPAPFRRKFVMPKEPSTSSTPSSQGQPKGEPMASKFSASQASVAAIAPAQFDEAIQIEPNSSTPGELTEFGEVDIFRIDLTEAGLLTVSTTGNTDTVGGLLDAEGQLLASNDGFANDDFVNFTITRFLPAGTYFVTVSEFFGGTGDYTLEASFFSQPPPVALNTPTPGELTEFGEVDAFRIDLAEAGLLTVHTTGNTDTVGELLDVQGRQLAFNDDFDFDLNFTITRFVPAGTYFVTVSEFSGFPGSYTLEASFSQPPPVALDTPTPGTLTEFDEVDVFRIDLAEAGFLTVRTTGATDTVGSLLDAQGQQLAFNDDFVNFAITRFVPAGTYFVTVSEFSGFPGSYTLEASFSQPSSVALDTPTPGTLTEFGEVDVFRIDLPTDGLLTVRTTGSTDTVGRLLDAQGQQLAFNDDISFPFNLNFAITRFVPAGTYFITISEASGGTGDYTLEASFSQPSSVALNTTTPGELAEFDEVDVFRIELSHAGILIIQTLGMLDTVGTLRDENFQILDPLSGSIDPLQDTSFAQLLSDDFGEDFNFAIVVPLKAGVYFVTVSEFSGGTGDYTLEASFADQTPDPPLSLGANLTLAVTASDTRERLSRCVSGFSSESCDAVIVGEASTVSSALDVEVGSEVGAGDYVLEIFSSPIRTNSDACAGNLVVEQEPDASAVFPGQVIDQVVEGSDCLRIAGDSGDFDPVFLPFDDDVYTFSISAEAPSVTFVLAADNLVPGDNPELSFPFDLIIFTVDDEGNDNLLGRCLAGIGPSDAINPTACSFTLPVASGAQSRELRALVFDIFNQDIGYTLDIVPSVFEIEDTSLPVPPPLAGSGGKVMRK